MTSVDNISALQKTRVYRIATLAGGVFVHLIVCGVVQSIGFMAISPAQLVVLGSLSMVGFLVMATLVGIEWNLSLEDPDMSLMQIIWALSAVIVTSVCATELKAIVLFTGTVMVVMGANRLNRRQQLVLGIYGVVSYVTATAMVSDIVGPGGVTEIVLILAFGLVLVFGPALYRFEAAVMEDIISDKSEELSLALDQIKELAICDELTGAFNRRHLMDLLAREKALADRKNDTFSVCYVDLDFFKKVNDRFGHAAGDAVLRNFVVIARGIVREIDCVARIGGEEFVLVMAGTSQTDAVCGAERLAAKLGEMQIADSEPHYRITASVGITEYRYGEEIRQMLERADKALYDAKRTGRNKIVLAGEESNPLAETRMAVNQF